MAAARWRRTLEWRLTTVVVMALVLWIVTTAVAVGVTMRRAGEAIVDQWTGFGRHVAARVEKELEGELRHLDRIAGLVELGGDVEDLRAAVQNLRLAESVLHLAPDGTVRWARSNRTGRSEPPLLARLVRTGGQWRGHPTDLVDTARGPRAFLFPHARAIHRAERSRPRSFRVRRLSNG